MVMLVSGLSEPGTSMMEEWTGFDVEDLVMIEGMGDLNGLSLWNWDMDECVRVFVLVGHSIGRCIY